MIAETTLATAAQFSTVVNNTKPEGVDGSEGALSGSGWVIVDVLPAGADPCLPSSA
jgi:hypothetical protein